MRQGARMVFRWRPGNSCDRQQRQVSGIYFAKGKKYIRYVFKAHEMYSYSHEKANLIQVCDRKVILNHVVYDHFMMKLIIHPDEKYMKNVPLLLFIWQHHMCHHPHAYHAILCNRHIKRNNSYCGFMLIFFTIQEIYVMQVSYLCDAYHSP